MSRERWKPPQQHYTPYSDAWFVYLAEISHKQAVDIAYLIDAYGKSCCMICGLTEDVSDYYPPESPLTLRLCDFCHDFQEQEKQRALQNGH